MKAFNVSMFFLFFIFLLRELVVSSSSACNFQPEFKLLNDGYKIPSLGFGTWVNVTDLDKVTSSVIYAIEVGFRHLDTAHLYANEPLIAKALADVFRRGVVQREDMFITTKLDAAIPTRNLVIPSLKQNLKRLRLDYVDLILIHTPLNIFGYPDYDYLDIWKGMEDAKRLGLARSIGVSNFNSSQINRLLRYGKIRPAVNEIEVNPTQTHLDLVAYCQSQGIIVTAYAPFGYLVPRSNNIIVSPTFEDPTLVSLARKYGKQTSQVAMRYLIDRGTIPIPRSFNRSHTLLNVDLFDFSLTQKEVYTINEFNRNLPVYVDAEDLGALFLQQYNYVKATVPWLLE